MYFGFTSMIALPQEDAEYLEPEETMSTLLLCHLFPCKVLMLPCLLIWLVEIFQCRVVKRNSTRLSFKWL